MDDDLNQVVNLMDQLIDVLLESDTGEDGDSQSHRHALFDNANRDRLLCIQHKLEGIGNG